LKLFRKHWSAAAAHIASLTILKLTIIVLTIILVVNKSHDRKREIKSQDAKSLFRMFRGGGRSSAWHAHIN
jgi:hypothetical protein